MAKKSLFLFAAICILSSTKLVMAQEVADSTTTTTANEQTEAPSMQLNEPAPQAAAETGLVAASAEKAVKSIDIQGNKSIGIAQILSKIKTRVGQAYQENVVSDDLKRLYNTG